MLVDTSITGARPGRCLDIGIAVRPRGPCRASPDRLVDAGRLRLSSNDGRAASVSGHQSLKAHA